jgi:hypothetical protein
MPPKAAKTAPKAAAAVVQHDENEEPRVGPTLEWASNVTPINPGAATGRSHHTASLFDGKLFVFGGFAGGQVAQHAKSVQQFEFATSTWGDVETSGEPHAGSSQAAVVDVGNGALIFYGGWSGESRVNAATTFNMEQSQWQPFETTGDKPAGATFHTATLVGKKVFVFGGNTAEGQSLDMHCLDLQSTAWSPVASLGAPAKRSSHTAAVVHEHLIVVIGGRGNENGMLNDVAIFDSSNSHWTIGLKVDGSIPPRCGHSAHAVGNNILVYGGVNEHGTLLSDMWLLDCEKPTHLVWSKIVIEGEKSAQPGGRSGHVVLDTLSSMYVIGGRTNAFGQVTGDILSLDTSSLAPIPSMSGMDAPPLATSPDALSHADDRTSIAETSPTPHGDRDSVY